MKTKTRSSGIVAVGRHWVVFFLLVVIILGAALRFAGIKRYLPEVYTNDEPLFLQPVMDHVLSGDLNPHFFLHPGSPLIYLISFVLAVYWRLAGFVDLPSFVSAFQNNPTVVYLIGRSISVLFGLGSIFLVYRLGTRIWNHRTGLAAAFFLALLPMHIEYSTMIRTDALAIFLILSGVICCLNYLERGKGWGVAAGLIFGVATATKYTSLPAGAVLLAAFWFRARDKKWGGWEIWGRLNFFFYLFIIGFFVGAPYVFLAWKQAWSDLLRQSSWSSAGYPVIPFFPQAWWYAHRVFPFACGGPLIPLLAGLGVFWVARTERRRVLILIAFPLCYLALILSHSLRYPRYLLYLLPFVGLFSAHCLDRFVALIKVPIRRTNLIFMLLVLGVGVFPLVKGIDSLVMPGEHELKRPTRDWLIDNIPPGLKIVYEFGCPDLKKDFSERWDLLDMSYRRIVSKPIAYYEDHGFDYAVVNRKIRSKLMRSPNRYPLAKSRYRDLSRRPLVATFGEEVWSRIEVYHLKNTRDLALRWVENNIPDGEGIAYEVGCPQLQKVSPPRWKLFDTSYQRIVSKPFRFYAENGYRYLILNRRSEAKLRADPQRWPNASSRYRALSKIPLVAWFGAEPEHRIEIYRLPRQI